MKLRDVYSMVFCCGNSWHVIHRGRVLPRVFYRSVEAHQYLGGLL